ncbi:UNVERIFIED_CONTAM: hypothetical protein K2H54_026940 [Gekko kuhli]
MLVCCCISAVAEADGIEPLISVLSSKRDGAVASAATVLTNLATQEPLRLSIQSHGIMSAIVEPLHSSNSLVQSTAALTVAAVGCDADARAEALANLISKKLVEIIQLYFASEKSSGALDILEEINLSIGRKNNFSEVALDKILDHNLPQKYSQMGYLASNNIILDGFYDYGQVKRGVKLLSLEELSAQELNDRRAIILVNAKPPDALQSHYFLHAHMHTYTTAACFPLLGDLTFSKVGGISRLPPND